MFTSRIRKRLALGMGAAVVALATGATASAATTPEPVNPPPDGLDQPASGAATEAARPSRGGVREGLEGAVGIGTGFSDTYGLGMEARVGLTFRKGLYAGGALQYYIGHSIESQSSHATFVGGEIGYKFFASRYVEIRPYVFGGPAFVTQVRTAPFFVESSTAFALQPGAMVVLHIGNAFVGGDARWLVTPNPPTLAILASGGVGF